MIKDAKNLKRGDVLLALDGHEIGNAETRRITVTKFIEVSKDGTAVIEVSDPNVSDLISPRRYLRYKEIKYGRLATLAGHRMLKTDDERYVTLDGQYEVYADDTHMTWCEDQHPVKITAKDRVRYRHMMRQYRTHWRVAGIAGHEWADACRDYGRRHWVTGKPIRGYLCLGGCEHSYTQWIAWNPHNENEFDAHWCDTATEAASFIPGGY